MAATEAQKAASRRYYERNREQLAAQSLQYYHKNKEECQARNRAYLEAHPGKVEQYVKTHAPKFMTAHRLTITEYEHLLEEQGGGCKLCGFHPEHKRLCVDHDHVTGRIRGLLCHSCNVALGLLRDNVETLQRAIEYLREPEV